MDKVKFTVEKKMKKYGKTHSVIEDKLKGHTPTAIDKIPLICIQNIAFKAHHFIYGSNGLPSRQCSI